MRILHRIGRLVSRVVSGALRLAGAAFVGAVALFGASLDFALGIVARLYGRFDAGWSELGREARARRAREGRRAVDPVALR